MAMSKAVLMAMVAVAMAAAGAAAAGAGGCGQTRKVTVQNLCGHDLVLSEYPVANSGHLFGPGFLLRHGTHAEFQVCSWTGSVSAPESATAEFHVAPDGGAWYQVSNTQGGGRCRVTVTPHGRPLQGHCPAAGCRDHGQCFAHAVPGGNCHNVDELKIIYYAP